ncbi:hypothetical protein Ancab_005188 [Ancistrocladus abbreviatus]
MGFNGWNRVLGWLISATAAASSRSRLGGLFGGFRGSGQHLNYLFERGGICLDKGCGIRVIGFGSSDGLNMILWLLLLILLFGCCWRWSRRILLVVLVARKVLVVVEDIRGVDAVATAAAAAAAVGAVAVGGG